MAPLDFAPAEPPRSTRDLETSVVASLRSSRPFTCLLMDDPALRSMALESVLDEIADPETRIVQVRNPLRSALTIERLFIQALGPELDVRVQYSDEELAKLLATRVGTEKRVLVVIHQPETLGTEARATLERMAAFFPTINPSLQILFCGPTCFVRPEPELAPQPPALATPDPEPEPAVARPRSLALLGPLLLLFAASGAMTWKETPAPVAAEPPPAPPQQVAVAAPPAPPPAITVRVGNLGHLGQDFASVRAERFPRL